ncbi:MAG: S8 family peptidase [Bacteroidales bacterium]|nr:S8 family peptidase [Bacteroidales bacterium]
MNKHLIVAMLCLLVMTAQAQNKSGLETKVFRMQVAAEKSLQTVENNSYVQKFNLEKEGNILYVGVVAKVSSRFEPEELAVYGIKKGSRVGNILTLRVPVDKLGILEANPDILQYDVARPVYPLLNNSRFDTRADSVRQGLDLPQGYTGKDVLVGITDWGFDFTHPNFYDTTRRQYRISKVWDQFKLSGPAPAGFNYGTEFSTKEALLDAKCDTPGVYNYSTHGTHVAGIAGGSGCGTKYRGIAPEVEFLLVSFKLNEAGALDAFAWLKEQAKEAGKRLVVNMSWGMYSFGANDGTSLISQAINSYADSGVVFVSSAGNNGDVNFHLMKVFDSLPDTLRTIVGFSGDVGEGISAWGNVGGRFKIGLAFSSGDSVFVPTPFYETNRSVFYSDTIIVVGSDTIRYDVAMESANINNGRPYAFVNIAKSNYKVHLFVTSAQQGDTVHLWNVYNKRDHAGNTGVAFLSDNMSGYSGGDHFYGLSEPAMAAKCITVAAHRADRIVQRDSSYSAGTIANFSSYGPTLTNPNKPEISAPGVGVVSSTSSYTSDNITPEASVAYHSRFYHFAALSGTSMASPTATGVVALMLQANPNITVDEVRDIIISTARTDNATGDLHGNCSIRWGYGKIDAMAAVKKALEKANIHGMDMISDGLRVYPNPAKNTVFVDTQAKDPLNVSVFNLDGKRLISTTLSCGNGSLDVSKLNGGIYLLQVVGKNGASTAKLVIAK